MQGLPQQLAFNYVRPKAVSSQYTEWRVNPMGGQIQIYPNELLRYQLALTNGYMDPYASYFEIQVETTLPTGALQLDSSAFSFISQSLLTSNSAEIQRINEYDQVGAILVQLGYNPIFAAGKQYMGLGRSFFTHTPKASTTTISNSNVTTAVISNSGSYTSTFNDYGSNTFNPLFVNNQQSTLGAQNVGFLNTNANQLPKVLAERGMSKYKNLQLVTPTGALQPPNIVGNAASFVSQINAAIYNQSWWGQANTARNGTAVPRLQYSLTSLENKFIDVGDSVVRTSICGVNNILSYNPTTPSLPYKIINPQTLLVKYYDPSKTQSPTGTTYSMQNTCGLHGYITPYSPQLSVGGDQPFISPTIPQCGMQNGRILANWLPINKMRFIVPYISSVMGILIPEASYSLIPLKALFNTMIELTLNKYALFSSGYNDRNIYDTTGMKYPINRDFKFTRFDYILQIYYFNDTAMKAYLQTQLEKGIMFSTQMITLTALYVIPNQLGIRGAWQINAPATYISDIFVRFIDASYQRYPFLRKQYALSMGITSMQFKYDTKWYPPQPITGNAGNPYYVDTTGNVQPYLFQLLRSKDLLFARCPTGITNAINFAINSRPYNVQDTRSLFPVPTSTNNQFTTPYVTKNTNLNTNTAMGYPFFHQNRCIGRALYQYSFQQMGHSKGYMNGIWVGDSRPFEVIFNTSVDNPFQEEVGMYIFTRPHYIVTMTKNGISLDRRPQFI